jgi:hypothetical protein
VKQKRSFGVTLTGCALIVFGVLFLLLPLLDSRRVAYNFFHIFHSSLQLVWLISTVILIGFIVGGFKILQLKEFGKGLVVYLAIIDIPHLVVGKAIYNNWYTQPIYLRNYFIIPLSILINFILIHFLNHPKVRRQFK